MEEVPVLILLRVAGSSPPVFLVKEDTYSMAERDLAEYAYNERSCPCDIVGAAEILCDGDVDPHGIFEFVDMVERPEDWPFTGDTDWQRYQAIFPALPDPSPTSSSD